MAQRINPTEYFGVVEAKVEQPSTSTQQTPTTIQYTMPSESNTFLEDDRAFKYIIIVGIVIVSIAALKYILKE